MIRVDPVQWATVKPWFSEEGTYKFAMQVSALDVEKPDRLTLLVDWDGNDFAIRSEDGQVLEPMSSSKVKNNGA